MRHSKIRNCSTSESTAKRRERRETFVCNFYSMTKNVDAIRKLFAALNSRVGNLPSMPGVFPDYPAPIVRNAADGREIAMARWGIPATFSDHDGDLAFVVEV
jgi:putative SOS response-associated peptidase YedK